MSYHRLPTARSPSAIDGRVAASWITGILKAPLISNQFLSNQMGPLLLTVVNCLFFSAFMTPRRNMTVFRESLKSNLLCIDERYF